MRATGSQTIVMDNVFVPEATISAARPRAGFAALFNIVVQVAMPLITGVYVGVAEKAVEIGNGLARKRANDPAVQWSSGEAVTALKVAQTLHEAMVRMANDLDFTPSIENTNEVFKLKAHAVEQARKAVQSAMDASGGAGFYRVNGLERLLRDVRASEYHPLPLNQQTFFAGRMALGLDPV
jgi:alkylation response protein AidB-like acyl-CoA dehydrogenase